MEEILELQHADIIKQQQQARHRSEPTPNHSHPSQEALRMKVLQDRGFQPESVFEDGNT